MAATRLDGRDEARREVLIIIRRCLLRETDVMIHNAELREDDLSMISGVYGLANWL